MRQVCTWLILLFYFIKIKLRKMQTDMSNSDTGLCTSTKIFWSGTLSIEQGKVSIYGSMECQLRRHIKKGYTYFKLQMYFLNPLTNGMEKTAILPESLFPSS